MSEIEPTIDNVREGDAVTIETGTLGEPGYSAFTVRVTRESEPVAYTRSLDWVEVRAREDDSRITRITRPALPIPTAPGERFWAVGSMSQKPREYIVTDERAAVSLSLGAQWDLADFPFTVVPAPEPETVPVPADLIQEAEEWNDARMRQTTGGASILARIVRAVREREGES